jgi:hypothetical protein
MAYREVDRLNGMNLSEWMEKQMLWLHSANAEFSDTPFEPFFTRTCVEFISDNLGHRVQAYTHYNRDEDPPNNGRPVLTMSKTTPLYVDMLPAFYFVGETYGGRRLNNIADCQDITRLHTSQSSGIYGKIKKIGQGFTNLTPKFTEHRLSIDVPDDSELAGNFFYPVQRGTHIDGWTVGYVSLIERLDPGNYHLEFGGQGPGPYSTKSTYKLKVRA